MQPITHAGQDTIRYMAYPDQMLNPRQCRNSFYALMDTMGLHGASNKDNSHPLEAKDQ
jgi:hypothetical protein